MRPADALLAAPVQSALCMHDRSRVEVFCYSLRATDQSTHRQLIEHGVEHFHEVWRAARSTAMPPMAMPPMAMPNATKDGTR